VTRQPEAFFAIDLGSATTSAALVGHLAGRWRLIAHTAVPATTELEFVLAELLRMVRSADRALLAELAGDGSSEPAVLTRLLPRLEAQTTPIRRIAILAGSKRQRKRLEEAAHRAGWLVDGASADASDPVALARVAFAARNDALLLGAERSPSGDEKRHLPVLVALAAAARRLRPELTIVLAGGAAAYEPAFTAPARAGEGPDRGAGTGPASAATPGVPASRGKSGLAKMAAHKANSPMPAFVAAPAVPAATRFHDAPAANPAAGEGQDGSPAHILLAPDSEAGQPAGSALAQVLEGLRALPNDSRLGIARSVASLAYVLGRSVEVVEVGLEGGLRASSLPIGSSQAAVVPVHTCAVAGSFAPEPTDDVIDSIIAWSTVALDRHRLADRLSDLRLVPWGDADGDGAVLRLATARAALWRMVELTPEFESKPLPELLVCAGGVFTSAPAAAVALAVADMTRRPGLSQIVCDQARLLGPLGTLADESERRLLLANLADDMLTPLGALLLPAGIKPGRSAGTLRVSAPAGESQIELHPGTVQVIDLPPGQTARIEADFRDTVRLGSRGRHFALDVSGGLGGLLVDLRDVPLRLPERPEPRRATLEALQRGMWPELDE